MTAWLPSTWQTNFKDTAHYVPLTGEIRASKIQGEGRGYPDSVSGDPDYVGNPTGIAKPEEMRMDDRRYRRMCWPDGRYINTVYNFQIFTNTGNNRRSFVPAGYSYPEITTDDFFRGSIFNSYRVYYNYNPFRNVSFLRPYDSRGFGTGSSTLNWYAYNAFEMDFHEKPPTTEMQYRKERGTSITNNQNQYVNQIKYCRGLDRTDSDWYSGGFGYGDQDTGTSLYPLSAVNINGDGPFNTPISKAGEIKFSDFRGKNKMYKTRSAIGHHEVEGETSNAVHYAKTNQSYNKQVLGNAVYSSPIYEYASLYMAGTYGAATTISGGTLANGNALNAVGYVNPDFAGKVSASGITLPQGSGALENTSIPARNYFTANAANSSSRYKPYWARKSLSEPKNSARIGRYDSVTKSMPTYDYVNQGTTGGSTHSNPNTVNRPPIVCNPRDGEMTHLIWYVDPSYNSNSDLGGSAASSWNSSAFPASETGPRIGERVVEFGILGRHYNTNRLVQGLYWDTGGRYGVQANDGGTGVSAGKGQFVDNTNAVARTNISSRYSEIFYASPSAENLFFGQTVWRMTYYVYTPHYDGTSPYTNPTALSYPTTHSSGLVYGGISGNYYSTRIVWAPGGTYDRFDYLKHFPEFDGVNA